MRWFDSPLHRMHDPGIEVWAGQPGPATEVPARAESIAAALAGDEAFVHGATHEHGRQPLERVHDPAMIGWLEDAWQQCRPHSPTREIVPDTVLHPGLAAAPGAAAEPIAAPLARLGYWCYDTMTPLVEGTYQAARAAADVALTALDAVLDGEPSAYALCRPPGHHAGRSVIGGFCFLNNAAVAAAAFAERAGAPVVILDLDYHHGNGTQQIFYDRPEVLYVSLHADPDRAFPYFTGRQAETGIGPGAGTTRNFVLPEGCDDERYLNVLAEALDIVAGSRPVGLVISLGLDTYERDPICDLNLTTSGYWRTGHLVRQLEVPAVVVQEGGYYVPDLGINARTWLRGFLGLDRGPSPADGASLPVGADNAAQIPDRHL